MEQNAKALKRNLIYNTAGNLIYFACQWLITGLFVKRLCFTDAGTLNAGYLATAMAVTNMFLTLASYGMRTYQVSDAKDKYTQSTYITSRIVTICAAIVFCGIYTTVMGYQGTQALSIYIYLVYKLLESITDVFHGAAQRNNRMDIIGISYAVRGMISVVLFSAVLYYTQNLIYALIAMTIVCYAFSLWYDIKNTKSYYAPFHFSSFQVTSALLLECAPLAIYGFLNTATASVPKLILERILGTSAIGVYNLVNSPVMIFQVGVAFLFTPFITIFSQKLASGDKKGFLMLSAAITMGVFAIGLIGIGGVLVLGKWGLNLLYGAQFTQYSPLLAPMIVCTVLTSLVLFFCMLLTVLRDMKGLILSNVIGIAASLLISTPLIRAFGLYGVSYASAVAMLCQCIALVLFGLSKLKKQEEKRTED